MEHYIWLALTTLASAFVGSFLAGYLKKKGENLATHEDLNNVVTQMTAITKATKEIEAKISGAEWQRQKLWEIRKDAFLEAMKELGNTQKAFGSLLAVYTTMQADGATVAALEQMGDAQGKFCEAQDAFAKASVAARMVGSGEIKSALFEVSGKVSGLFTQMLIKNFNDIQPDIFDLICKVVELEKLIRRDLGIESEAMLRSNESLVAPSPG